MKKWLCILFGWLIFSFAQAQGPKSKPKPKADIQYVTDTLVSKLDTVSAKFYITVENEDGTNYLTRVKGFIVGKSYIGKIMKREGVEIKYYNEKWEVLKPEDIDQVLPLTNQ
jgi:outer membrane lipoprotein-sorting protein